MRRDARERIGIDIGRLPGEMGQPGCKVDRVLAGATSNLQHRAARRQDPPQDRKDWIAIARRRGRGQTAVGAKPCHAEMPGMGDTFVDLSIAYHLGHGHRPRQWSSDASRFPRENSEDGMRLHWSPRSPFVRKVMIVAHELGVSERIACVRTVVATAQAARRS